MKYAENIPDSLKNKPQQMVRHCLLKKSLGESLDLTGIKTVGMGKFAMIYYKNGEKRVYYVDFGDDTTMPSCTCPDWKSSAYPCKHFFAIFKKFPAWNLNSLSTLYIKSPFLNLDEELEVQSEEPNKIEDSEDITEITDSEEHITATDLPASKKKKFKEVDGEACRSVLNSIRSLTFLIENNVELVDEVYEKLTELKISMENGIPKEKGIPLLQNVKKENRPFKQNQRKHFKVLDIAARKKKDLKSKRIGETKDRFQEASKINIIEIKDDIDCNFCVNYVE